MLVHDRRGLRHFGWPGDLLSDLSHQRQRLTGIALMCAAVATFACLDATGKYLLHYMDPLQIVWARYLGAFLLAFIFLNPINRPGMMVTARPFLQIGRSALLLTSTAMNFFALRYLQLDEALISSAASVTKSPASRGFSLFDRPAIPAVRILRLASRTAGLPRPRGRTARHAILAP